MSIGRDTAELVVAGSGDIHIAPYGTTLPTAYSTALNAAFKNLGYITEDGLGLNWSPQVQDFMAWQSRHPVRRELTGVELAVSAALEQWNEETMKAVFGGGEVTDVGAGSYRYDFLADDEQLAEVSAVIDWQDGDREFRLVIPRANATEAVDVKLGRTELATLPLGLKALGGDAEGIAYLLSNDHAIGTGS